MTGNPDSGISPEVAEDTVCRAFAQVLGVSQVDPGTPFGALGGDSLRAIRVLSRVWQDLGVELPVHALNQDTTPGQLASAVRVASAAS